MPIIARESADLRPATEADASAMWSLFREAAAGGDTLSDDASVEESSTMAQWFDPAVRSWVAVDGDDVVGMYKLGANRADRGAHVSSATFVVRASHRGRGIGRQLVEHGLREARDAGFAAMQFNFVVSSNVGALALYERLGFEIVGTLPKAFLHKTLGAIDAHVLFITFDRSGS